MTVNIRKTIEAPWTELEPVRVGSIPSGQGTPDSFVTVSDNDKPILRVDVYVDRANELCAFSDVIVWKHWLVIGIGHRVHLVPLAGESPITLELDDYFGHLYPLDRCLLMASGRRLLCVAIDGVVTWSSEELGIDGVIVSDVSDGIIDGAGEWDPPGGWKPFKIALDSGLEIADSR